MHFMDDPKGNPKCYVDRRQRLSSANVSLDLMFYGMLQLIRLVDENCWESSVTLERTLL